MVTFIHRKIIGFVRQSTGKQHCVCTIYKKQKACTKARKTWKHSQTINGSLLITGYLAPHPSVTTLSHDKSIKSIGSLQTVGIRVFRGRHDLRVKAVLWLRWRTCRLLLKTAGCRHMDHHYLLHHEISSVNEIHKSIGDFGLLCYAVQRTCEVKWFARLFMLILCHTFLVRIHSVWI